MTREEHRVYSKKYYAAHKEERTTYNKKQYSVRKEEFLLRCKKWKEDNKVKISEYNKKYYAAHKEELAEYHKKFYQNNKQVWKKHQASSVYKEYQRVYQSQRRKDLKDRGSYFPKDIKDLYSFQGGSCYYCSVSIEDEYHIDHMNPLSRGGSNWIDNICLACVRCNLSKHTKTAEEFMNV